ncbi:hypothetical protein [Rufibacter sp. LB8]|uniref:hypothetical protein n=1 Tax=Rufibacter sp. LB8 TaxID=2777781 RepID=UPI00178C571D|nr:hypothetical protein [Rufibacter sp. LB8]
MKTNLLLLVLALLSFSCLEEDEPTPGALPKGTYVGTFLRTSPTALYAPATVTLHLQGNTYSGSSEKQRYPVIGAGTYHVSGNYITFESEGFYTADFDWTLILKARFTISQDGDSILLTKQTGDITDIYRLTKQTETNK